MTANHYWSAAGERSRFTEQAAPRGLAFNARSLSQASMGIAADDIDNDGDLDFYVTHFADDYNTLYEQVYAGVWSDKTAKYRLAEPTLRMLGYGSQWLDVNGNGKQELLVANGHVDDFSHNDKAFRMPTQLFRRTESGSYEGLEAADDVLARPKLGRALALADIDRDRRVDAVITHLFDPVSVLVNRSPQQNESIEIRLVGTEVHRDAIGAIVQLQSEEQVATKWLLGGNGYQCSNERTLRFAWIFGEQTVTARVTWPDGKVQVCEALKKGHSYLLIEGKNDLDVWLSRSSD